MPAQHGGSWKANRDQNYNLKNQRCLIAPLRSTSEARGVNGGRDGAEAAGARIRESGRYRLGHQMATGAWGVKTGVLAFAMSDIRPDKKLRPTGLSARRSGRLPLLPPRALSAPFASSVASPAASADRPAGWRSRSSQGRRSPIPTSDPSGTT